MGGMIGGCGAAVRGSDRVRPFAQGQADVAAAQAWRRRIRAEEVVDALRQDAKQPRLLS